MNVILKPTLETWHKRCEVDSTGEINVYMIWKYLYRVWLLWCHGTRSYTIVSLQGIPSVSLYLYMNLPENTCLLLV